MKSYILQDPSNAHEFTEYPSGFYLAPCRGQAPVILLEAITDLETRKERRIYSCVGCGHMVTLVER